MVNCRGSKDGKPNRAKTGDRLQSQSAECPIELKSFKMPESVTGERGKSFETIRRIRRLQSNPQVRSKFG